MSCSSSLDPERRSHSRTMPRQRRRFAVNNPWCSKQHRRRTSRANSPNRNMLRCGRCPNNTRHCRCTALTRGDNRHMRRFHKSPSNTCTLRPPNTSCPPARIRTFRCNTSCNNRRPQCMNPRSSHMKAMRKVRPPGCIRGLRSTDRRGNKGVHRGNPRRCRKFRDSYRKRLGNNRGRTNTTSARRASLILGTLHCCICPSNNRGRSYMPNREHYTRTNKRRRCKCCCNNRCSRHTVVRAERTWDRRRPHTYFRSNCRHNNRHRDCTARPSRGSTIDPRTWQCPRQIRSTGRSPRNFHEEHDRRLVRPNNCLHAGNRLDNR